MKNLKLISLIGVCFLVLLSCQNGDEPRDKNNVILNYSDFGEYVKGGSITPISATVYVGNQYREICFSEKRDSLELVINDYYSYRYSHDNIYGVRFESPISYETSLTVYNLKPGTTYYYFVTEDGYYPEDPRLISPIHSFKTNDINLYVNMGGAIEWCGVNYLENRGDFHWTQFLSNSIFSCKELPDPADETIEGNWRYPTLQELEELSETCIVTMVDFSKKFVCLTGPNGNNLYVPFTYQKLWDDWNDGYRHLMLIPTDEERSGLYVSTPNLNQFTYGVKCGDELEKYKLEIEKYITYKDTDFFYWSYIDSTGGTSQEKKGEDKRGVRFVQ